MTTLGEQVEEIWRDPKLYLDGGLDEAEEETPGLLQRIINTFTWRIAIGMGDPEHYDFLTHATSVKENMERIAREDGECRCPPHFGPGHQVHIFPDCPFRPSK